MAGERGQLGLVGKEVGCSGDQTAERIAAVARVAKAREPLERVAVVEVGIEESFGWRFLPAEVPSPTWSAEQQP